MSMKFTDNSMDANEIQMGFSHTVFTLNKFNRTSFPKSSPESTNYSAIDNEHHSTSKDINDMSMKLIDILKETDDIQIEIHHKGVQPYGIQPINPRRIVEHQ